MSGRVRTHVCHRETIFDLNQRSRRRACYADARLQIVNHFLLVFACLRRMLPVTIVAMAVTAQSAHAQSPAAGTDPVLIGYERLHHGDLSGASQYFEDQLKRAPDDLAFRFGWLMAEQARIQLASGRAAKFEKDLDAIITLGEARYERTHADVGAMFYLAIAYLMRAAYRFEHDKGMWGAARDGANAKSYVEAYLKLYPRDGDAYLVLGS